MFTFLRTRTTFFWYGLVATLVLLGLFVVPGPLVDLLWMQAVGYESVYWTLLRTRVLLFAVAFTVVALYLGVNSYVLLRHFPLLQWLNEGARRGPTLGEVTLTPRMAKHAATAFTLFLALLFGLRFAGAWDLFFRFGGDQAFGTTDPIYGRDLSYYLLQLPFIEAVQNACSALALLGLAVVGAGYVFLGNVRFERGSLRAPRGVVLHVAVNLALLLGMWGWGYALDRFQLLYSPGNVVFGAGYVDVNIVVPVLWAMVIASAVLIVVTLVSALRNRLRWLIVGLAGYAVLAVGGLFIAPGVVQQVRVEPYELELETPYIRHNIELTRRAYALDRIREQDYAARPEVTLAQVTEHRDVLRNVRLWDPRLLIPVYRQLQEIRLYYQFYGVDVDRYVIDSMYTEVMLSARELEPTLPERADTWVNRHLQYTHGYGLVMSPVAQRGTSGTPELLVRDIPPRTTGGLTVTQPAIYYGEHTSTYRIVRTEVPELDYPQGDENVYTRYEGSGGVSLGSFWRRLLYAWHMGDVNIVLSDYITSESRIQYWNRLDQRIQHIAPFLRRDADPYLVLSEGRLFWMQDAYTTARTFPYAEPSGAGFNYIRNAAKIVVDAYDGAVQFYVADPDDPILGAYRAAFPGMFQDLSAMSADLRRHVRYPEDLFTVQMEKYSRYHMTAPQVFYNTEDLWTIPREQYGGEEIPMRPYYILMELPDQEGEEFLLMQPMTPQNRHNMIAWMAARCDPEHYGELIVYRLPKDRLIYGPNQIESLIDQDTQISQQLSLWNQSGSRVIRGNLIVLPVAESFLYVEPVFLLAEGTQIPELQRVIVASGERVAMEPTLDIALNALFGEEVVPQPDVEPEDAPAGAPAVPAAVSRDLLRARETLDRAMDALRNGDFATFGTELEALRRILNQPEVGGQR